jgi:hypothetical protein
VANPGGRFFATETAAISDFVLEVGFEKRKGEQEDLGLYRAVETKDGLRPGLLMVRPENKSRVSSVLAVKHHIPEKRTDE